MRDRERPSNPVHSFTNAVHSFTTAVHSFTTAVHSFTTAVHSFTTAVHSFTNAVHSTSVASELGAVRVAVRKTSSNSNSFFRVDPTARCQRQFGGQTPRSPEARRDCDALVRCSADCRPCSLP